MFSDIKQLQLSNSVSAVTVYGPTEGNCCKILYGYLQVLFSTLIFYLFPRDTVHPRFDPLEFQSQKQLLHCLNLLNVFQRYRFHSYHFHFQTLCSFKFYFLQSEEILCNFKRKKKKIKETKEAIPIQHQEPLDKESTDKLKFRKRLIKSTTDDHNLRNHTDEQLSLSE